MSPNLEGCPDLAFEVITTFLTFNDLCSLRLCSRTLAAKTTQNRFKSYFHTKHVDITSNSLRAFINATNSGELGCLIQNLVLVGVVNNPKSFEYFLREGYKHSLDESSDENSEDDCEKRSKDDPEAKAERAKAKKAKARRNIELLKQRQTEYENLHRSGMDVTLLSKAFKNIIANSETGKLLSISLEVAAYYEDVEQRSPPLTGGEWSPIWRSAANTFHTVIQSLASSGLLIKGFNIFNSRNLQRCSLACNELSRIDFTHPGLASCLGSLKSLSISLSDEIILNYSIDGGQSQNLHQRADEGTTAEMEAEIGSFSFAKTLNFCGQLEDLEIHQYQSQNIAPYIRQILRDVAELETPLKLKRLVLRGLFVSEEGLLAVIQRTGIRKLSMYRVSVLSGSFRSIFDYCTSDAAGMEELHFEGLRQASSLVSFEGLDVSSLAPETPGPSCGVLRRKGREIRRKISYRTLRGSRGFMRWKKEMRREYGPPGEEFMNYPQRRVTSLE